MGRIPDARPTKEMQLFDPQDGIDRRNPENKTMPIFRRFRKAFRTNKPAEVAEVSRILRTGPHDRPANIRHLPALSRSLNGWW